MQSFSGNRRYGIDRYSRALLCSTATEVTEKSHRPVMVVRPQQDRARQQIDWIIVAADDAPGSDLVVGQALRDVRLCKLPVLAIRTTPQDTADARTRTLDDHLKPWRRWYPDVHIYGVTCGADVASFIEKKDNWVPLAVIGSADADRRLAKVVGSHDRHIFRHPESSTLIIRGNKATQPQLHRRRALTRRRSASY